MSKNERERYFNNLDEELLLGGAAFSEWCTFISKDVHTAFINGADLSTVVISLACIETYLRTENSDSCKKNLRTLIEDECFINDEDRHSIHKLRLYRNKWVHMYDEDDYSILESEAPFISEAEEMACLAVKMMLTVLYSNQFI